VLPTPSSYRRRNCFPRRKWLEGEESPISFPLPFLRIKNLASAFPRMFLEGRKGEESLYHSHSPFSVSRTLGSAFPSMFLEGKGEPLGLPRNMHFPFEITNTRGGGTWKIS
jgi:hypothetical protein